ncbi:MAG: helix-turn-helix transcriptional regulator [Clostridia bacterium]|nr:helix-turn-helix transcriptional regulator [Clostridia bacterium]
MKEDNFSVRLAVLRNRKGVSARDMSLSIGQNPGYINDIESGKSYPSMTVFFYICDYLQISPKEFFDDENVYPQKIEELLQNLKKLDEKQLDGICQIVAGLTKNS